MQKKITTVRLPDEVMQYLDEVQDKTNLSRSKTIELMSGILQDYFSLDQICLEADTRSILDGRSKEFRN